LETVQERLLLLARGPDRVPCRYYWAIHTALHYRWPGEQFRSDRCMPDKPPHQYPTPISPIQPYNQGFFPSSTQIPTSRDSTATMGSQGMRGYKVFLDGNYIGTKGMGGDLLDGKSTFRVVGNQNHEVRVYDGRYPKTMFFRFFKCGSTKIIYVEPGTASYI
jgi:hypothetical protein